MSSDVIRVSPERIRFKLEDAADLVAPVWPGDWDMERRLPLDDAAKHRSIVQRYRDGVPWEDTELFRNIYRQRLERGEPVRGCSSMETLTAQYYERVDGLFHHLKTHGFLERVDGTPVKIPDVYLGRDGEVILGNDGNHRIPMAKILKLPSVLVKVRTRHPDATMPERVTLHPVLPEGAAELPAMTTPAEQFTYYQLAKAHAKDGAVVELGTWLGAATVYLAAGVRDSGHREARVHSFDRFQWQPAHTEKAGGKLTQPMVDQVKQNLGPLDKYVWLHEGEFLKAEWHGAPIGCLVADGPKRIREISRVLTTFGPSLPVGAVMAWQDFAYFPAYDLPAFFDRLEQDGVVRFRSGVYPGTTAVFSVERPMTAADVAEDRHRLDAWGPDRILETWERWAQRLPHGQVPRFMCGAALFLSDCGLPDLGAQLFRGILAAHRDDVAPKWELLRETRPAFVKKYPALMAELARG